MQKGQRRAGAPPRAAKSRDRGDNPRQIRPGKSDLADPSRLTPDDLETGPTEQFQTKIYEGSGNRSNQSKSFTLITPDRIIPAITAHNRMVTPVVIIAFCFR